MTASCRSILQLLKDDPFNPKAWWKEGRQIRWVLSEYGAWFYYYWQALVN